MKRDKPPSKQGLVYAPMDVAELDEIYLNEDAWIADDDEEEEWTTLTEEEAKAEMQEYNIQQEVNQAAELLNLSPNELRMRNEATAKSKMSKSKSKPRTSGKTRTSDKDKDECQLKITTAMIPDKKKEDRIIENTLGTEKGQAFMRDEKLRETATARQVLVNREMTEHRADEVTL